MVKNGTQWDRHDSQEEKKFGGKREGEKEGEERESKRNIRKVKIKNKENIECWLGLRETETLMHYG